MTAGSVRPGKRAERFEWVVLWFKVLSRPRVEGWHVPHDEGLIDPMTGDQR